MKILIMTTPLGQGHNAVANALADYFTKRDYECSTVDMYEYIDPILKEIISMGFSFSMKSAAYVKGMASEIYDLNEKRDVTWDYSLGRLKNALFASELKKLVEDYKPDLIICTQVYAAQVVDILKEKKATEAMCAGIITDFTVQTYWEDVEHFEYICVPSGRLAHQLKERGIDFSRVLTFGMPIAERFATKIDQTQARQLLGLVPHLKTVLIMGGGRGFGELEKFLTEIDHNDLNVQIIVVCGENERLYKKLEDGVYKKPILILGYVDNMELVMAAADCLVSKPGGISTAESLAKGVPMIMVDPLPGVEERNAEFLLNNGAALLATKTFSITEALHLLFDNEERSLTIQACMKSLAKPEATTLLGDFLLAQAGQ